MKYATRLDSTRLKIHNTYDVDATLFANEQVPVENSALEEASKICDIAKTAEGFGTLNKVVFTPDFHKGAGIPVGTVLDTTGFIVPQAVGTDICCGMRLSTIDVSYDELQAIGPKLDIELRNVFFNGQRNIASSPMFRTAMLREGVFGISENLVSDGMFGKLNRNDLESDFDKYHDAAFQTNDLWNGFDDYCEGSGLLSYDDQLGSIGGGNHFVELQRVDTIVDKQYAYQKGIKSNQLLIMAHSGSVSHGTAVGKWIHHLLRETWKGAHPDNKFYVLDSESALAKTYMNAMNCAANFALINRLSLTLAAVNAISKALGKEVHANLVYDSGHNLIWDKQDHYIHRKGACPAGHNEHPVIVPGSMGDLSWLLKSKGNEDSLCSACHGAGRLARRGDARHGTLERLDKCRVITKIDVNDSNIRKDIRDQIKTTLLEESPDCYKDITPVINTIRDAGIAEPVASLSPILTVKG